MSDRARPAAATLIDVANEAGVSLATASRVLNGSTRRVADAYRVRVQDAARRLRYSANSAAQAVARGRSRSVALVVGDIADPYFSSIAAGVVRASEERGMLVTIAMTGGDHEREIAVVNALRSQRPQVLLLAGSRTDDEEHEETLERELVAFEAEGGRVAVVGQATLPFSAVTPDNLGGARALAVELLRAGYRSFSVLAGPRDLLTARDRLDGFLEGLAIGGVTVPAENIVRGAFTRDGGYAGAGELLESKIDFEVVFAVNDVMAVGAMACFRDRQSRPIAIAGFDDIGTLRDLSPSLTTVRLPLEELGSTALSIALDDEGVSVVGVEASVVLRSSTTRR